MSAITPLSLNTLPPAQCVALLLAQADRLGVEVRWHPQRDAAAIQALYEAPPGRPGLLILHAPPPTVGDANALCTLITHEMVHVLQHWHGRLQAVLPLGWPTDGAAARERQLSIHEAEAFTAQERPEHVLQALQELPSPVDTQLGE
jgi:hypothetical protein